MLLEEKLTFKASLQKEGMTLALGRLHCVSYWITPGFFPIRFDVRLFIAEAPSGQKANHDGVELTNHLRTTPAGAFDRYHKNHFVMVFPTLITMKALSRFHTIDTVISSTSGKQITIESG